MIFKKLTCHNFTSWEHMTLDLDSQGLFLVLGNNGEGKSNIIEAIHFCLFNSTIRNVPVGEVVHNKKNKNCYVRLQLITDDGKRVLLTRFRQCSKYPNGLRVIIDGQEDTPIGKGTEMLVKSLLGLTPDNFLSSVCPNCSKFSLLTDVHRKKWYETAIGLEKLPRLFETSKELRRKCENKIYQRQIDFDECCKQIEISDGEINSLKTQLSKPVHVIKNLNGGLKNLESEVLALKDILENLEESYKSKAENKNKFINKMSLLQGEFKEVERNFNNLSGMLPGDTCSLCGMVFDAASSKFSGLENRYYNLKKRILKISKKVNKIEKWLNEVRLKIKDARLKIGDMRDQYQKLNEAKIRIEENQKLLKSLLKEVTHKRTLLMDDKGSLKKELSKSLDNMRYYVYCNDSLGSKGQFKTFMISKSLPIFNERIAYYLTKMTTDISTSLEISEDGKFRLVYNHINGGDSYKSSSEGEQRIVDIAIDLAKRDININGSIKSNLLLLDEQFFYGLDSKNLFHVTQLLQKLDYSSILTISQDVRLSEMIDIVYKVTKENGFSQIRRN